MVDRRRSLPPWVGGSLAIAVMTLMAMRTEGGAQDLEAITSRVVAETERILKDTGIPAISIAIVQNGELVWANALGQSNLAAGAAATEETFFSTGSTLKPVTAAAVMQLVDEGMLSLDTALNSIVGPDLSIEGADDVTLRHMLGHHSGLEGPVSIVPLWGRASLMSPEDLFAVTRRTGPPGTQYRYCNECYSLIGYVIELVSGRSYDQYLAEEIFGPLGVEYVTPSVPTASVVERLALPYGSEDGVTIPIDQIRTNVFAAGDAYLRAKDMAVFLAALLNGGSYRGVRILREASVKEILRPQFEGSNSGLGINVSELSGRDIVTKNGIFTGYHSFMIGDPERGHGVYTVANSTMAGQVVAVLSRYALQLLWGQDPEPLPRFSGLD